MTTNREGLLEMGGGKLKKALAASVLAVALTIPALAPPASAQAAPQGTIEAFIGTNLVNVQGYPANEEVTIQVVRNDLVVGSVTGNTDGTGFVEFNHAGGGAPPAGDCFTSDATPDIVAGDTIRTVYLDDLGNEVVQSEVVRDVGINFDTISTNVKNGTITVSGHARSLADAPIAPGDILELRLNKGSADRWDTGPGLDQDRPGRKDLRVDIGENLRANGTFTRVLKVGTQDARDWRNSPGEVGLEWSAAAPAGEEVNPPAIFVADEGGGEAILGCPPLGEYAINNSNPNVINKAFVGGNGNLVLRGASFDASNVRVTLNDRNAATAPVVVDVQPAAAGAQNWAASFTNAQVEALRDGMLTATAVYTVSGQDVSGADITRNFRGENLRILKDVVAPARAPVATPKAGVYNRAISVKLNAQAGTKIHYTVNGSRPTANSRVYTRPIRVTGTQRIKAVAVDRAGNTSPIGVYFYRIR